MNQRVVDYKGLDMRIKNKRLERGLLQSELAKKVALSCQHISNIENNRTKIGLETLIAIANVLNCSVDELLYDSIQQTKTIAYMKIKNLLDDFSESELKIVAKFLKYYLQLFQHIDKELQILSK